MKPEVDSSDYLLTSVWDREYTGIAFAPIYDLSFDSQGDLWLSMYHADRIVKLSPQGQLLRVFEGIKKPSQSHS